MKYVLVAINLPAKNLFRQFIYRLPDVLLQVAEGWRVIVPFGNQKVEGFVVRTFLQEEARGLLEKDKPGYDIEKVKGVIAALGTKNWFTGEMMDSAKWLAKHYMCSLAEAMRLFIPGRSSVRRRPVYRDGKIIAYEIEERLKARMVIAYAITQDGRIALQEGDLRAKAQMNALRLLDEMAEPVDLKQAGSLGVSGAVLRTLAEKGWVSRMEKRLMRNSYDRQVERKEILQLTEEQEKAVNEIKTSMDAVYAGHTDEKIKQEYLLQGVTGSGKTEVYLRATEYALKHGWQVLVLVPEIALTTQIVQRFQAWFGEKVAVAHSKLSQNERGDVWYRVLTGDASILIGVRSAVFAPFRNLGLVIIDEEQENSYKQEERPSYHARDVIRFRCRKNNAILLLGSATPSLETYYSAVSGAIGHLRLTGRPSGAVLPKVEIVDMREELAQKNYSVISRKLRREIISAVNNGEQAVVLLNRRGYSTFVMCRDCGETLDCPHCAVSLVYHAADRMMRCHYCGNAYPIPQTCPSCGSRRIKYFGSGTQKAELEINQMPGVKVLRMDQDSTVAKMAHEDIIRQFAFRQANVLLGTQMVAKGHDIPDVTLVGILAADSTLNLPDFRASERGFSLLTQAAGRAGRGIKPGRVVLQTYDPENETIMLAARQDYETFAAKELKLRKELFFPPFSEIMKIIIVDKLEERAYALGDEVADFLRRENSMGRWNRTEIMGPFPSGVARIRDLYHIGIVIKSTGMDAIRKCLSESRYMEVRNMSFDVDPVTTI